MLEVLLVAGLGLGLGLWLGLGFEFTLRLELDYALGLGLKYALKTGSYALKTGDCHIQIKWKLSVPAEPHFLYYSYHHHTLYRKSKIHQSAVLLVCDQCSKTNTVTPVFPLVEGWCVHIAIKIAVSVFTQQFNM